MSLQYETLIGHLYVVGGRSISVAPPGLLVESAPKKAARGREFDTFFALVMPAGESVAPAAFYENMAQLAADTYFGSTGSVTAAVRDVLSDLNENLYEHNQSHPTHYEANMFCGVLRSDELYLGKVGAGAALLWQEGEIQQFPAAFSDRDALVTTPLGAQPVPEIKMGRYEVDAGTRLLLGDLPLAEYPLDQVTEAAALEDIGAVLSRLRELTTTHITLLAVEFITPEQEIALPAVEAESTTAAKGMPAVKPSAGTAAAAPKAPGTIRRSAARGAAVKRALGAAAAGGAAVTGGAAKVFNRVVPAPAEGQKGWISSPAGVGITVLIPIVVVVLVILFWISGTGESEFDQCLRRASDLAATARGIASSDVAGQTAAWNGALTLVSQCESLKEGGDPVLTQIKNEGRAFLDRQLLIDRRQVSVVDAFTNADLTQIVLQGDDIYVLDSRNQQVYRLTLGDDGLSAAPGTRTPIQAMRRSGQVIQFTVGDLIDIAWAESGAGLAQANVITALDSNGVLIACPPRFLQDCTAQMLRGQEAWGAPKAYTFWEGRLYILDPEANQIWRYDPSGGSYAGMPLEYFTGQSRPDIRNAIDFGITLSGEIYILMRDGVVVRFSSARLQPFAFSGFADNTTAIGNANAMFLNTLPIAQGLFFVNRENRTVYETTMAGTFLRSYRAHDEDLFAQLSHVVADANQIVYVLSGNSVLAFPRGEQR